MSLSSTEINELSRISKITFLTKTIIEVLFSELLLGAGEWSSFPTQQSGA